MNKKKPAYNADKPRNGEVKMKHVKEIGHIAAASVNCKDCGQVFVLDRGQLRWYSNMGYPLPKRCPDCRMKRKEAKKREKKTDANTRDPK